MNDIAGLLAEGEGFEPPDLSINGFQDRRLKPLGHPSVFGWLGNAIPWKVLLSSEIEKTESSDHVLHLNIVKYTRIARCVMTREEVYKDIEEKFGLVPSFLKAVPDSTLELEWELIKRLEFDEGPVPNKYRELIGLGISAVTKCQYCIFYHAEMAKLHGATDEEIEDAVHFSKATAGWSTYVNGLQIDFDQFKKEVEQACEYARTKKAA